MRWGEKRRDRSGEAVATEHYTPDLKLSLT